MDWKLGISMSSSGCRSLSSPHVTLQLRVAESDTQDQQHTIEMTLPQFMVRESLLFLFLFALLASLITHYMCGMVQYHIYSSNNWLQDFFKN